MDKGVLKSGLELPKTSIIMYVIVMIILLQLLALPTTPDPLLTQVAIRLLVYVVFRLRSVQIK